MPKYNVNDRVILVENYPADNFLLHKGDSGTIMVICDTRVLILFDKATFHAQDNDHFIEDYFDIDDEEDEDVYSGRFWWVHIDQISPRIPPFRSKRKGETMAEYRVCKKIHEIDYKWKSIQNAKTNTVSI